VIDQQPMNMNMIIIALASLSWFCILTQSPLILLINNKFSRTRYKYIEDLVEGLHKEKKLIGYWLVCHWCGGTWLVLLNTIIHSFCPAFVEWFATLAIFAFGFLTIKKLTNITYNGE